MPLFLFFLDNEETDSAEFEIRYDYCTFVQEIIRGMGMVQALGAMISGMVFVDKR